jgi:hypothetical protein
LKLTEKNYSRPTFVKLCRIAPQSFNQRNTDGQNAMAWGRRKPVHHGVYTPLDACAMLLTSMLSYFARIDLKSAADVVVDHWPSWIRALAAAERNMDAVRSDQDYFVVGVTYKEDWSNTGRREKDFTPSRLSVGFGKLQKATDEAERDGKHDVIFPLPMQAVVSALRGNAEMARPKIEVPDFLCPGPPESEAFKQWFAAETAHVRRTDKSKVTT